MKSVVVHAEGKVRVEERPIPQLKTKDDVLVKIVSSGLCGSDIPRIFAQGAHYYPITLGHEFSGYVESYGCEVSDLLPGDAVACVPLLPCFTCPQCKHGFFSLCKQYQFIGSRSEGGNAEYVVVKRANLYRLPSTMPIEDGAFIEPITVGLHAFNLAHGCEGKNVVIVGAGTIGLLAMQCARELGAKSITAVDINPEKLELAKTLGSTHALNSREMSAADIQSVLAEHQFDQLILETAGTPQTVSLSIEIAGPRAQVALVGTLHKDLMLASTVFGQILRKELTLLGSWMNYSSPWPGTEWETATRLLTEKRLQLDPLIAHRGNMESYASTIEALNGTAMQGKILLSLP
ncbi:galactitol-1-phosphate 5-dehydrogenase [Scandinavium manionii]|uniref:galactitol-1-phosphate 5-dehydrogenase n=1 Tax=Scandinavium manionii TaxID=2926520 RepID=UPI002165CF8B|nr:galactitol-1-phosphate 5-dehydrogenase [Scandinavium manionii]MCS2148512.1 galactitol-1-phosphate 5-dehydrogenase [Scandinavium manionii]